MLRLRLRFVLAAASALALCTSGLSFAAVFTSINTFGNDDGSERCLVGAGDLCTKGGPYLGKFSITHVYAASTSRTLTRLDDTTDKLWTAPLNYIEVRPIAHYLSGHGTSTAGVLSSTSVFTTFADVADNHVAGTPLDSISDYVALGSLTNIDLPAGVFQFLYKSLGNTYTSNNFAGNGFDNGSSGALDHMVSWSAGTATDLRGNLANVYLIAFERLHVDNDFQDGVYELRIAQSIPEPSMYVTLGLGLGLLGWTSLKGRARA
jgi:hypothetical protein